VFRRSLALLAATAAVLALAPLAQAARVTIRVEGFTQTIFARAPRAVEAANALEALQDASVAGEFYVHVQQSSFGPYVDQIGLYAGTGSSGWAYKVNGASPPVGADQYQLKDGDTVLWYWGDFSGGSPKTLLLVKRSRRCYAAYEQDDKAARTPARGVRIWIGERARARSATGRFCLKAHTGLVHVRKPGAVRSNGLP
jgi:Domain of unknown function (DUF4430)